MKNKKYDIKIEFINSEIKRYYQALVSNNINEEQEVIQHIRNIEIIQDYIPDSSAGSNDLSSLSKSQNKANSSMNASS